MKYILILVILLYPTLTMSHVHTPYCVHPTLVKNYKWSGKGRLYDQRNQYLVACRLVKEKRVKNQMDWTQKLMYSHWFWIYLFVVVLFGVVTFIDFFTSL